MITLFFGPEGRMFSSVQSLSRIRLFPTPWTTARQAFLSITNSQSPPKPMSIESGDAIQPSHPLSSPFPPAPNLSQHQGLFKWVSSLHQVAKVLEFQTHIVKYIYGNFRALYICLNLTRAGKPKSADNLHLKLPLLNVSWCYCEIDSAQPLCLL